MWWWCSLRDGDRAKTCLQSSALPAGQSVRLTLVLLPKIISCNKCNTPIKNRRNILSSHVKSRNRSIDGVFESHSLFTPSPFLYRIHPFSAKPPLPSQDKLQWKPPSMLMRYFHHHRSITRLRPLSTSLMPTSPLSSVFPLPSAIVSALILSLASLSRLSSASALLFKISSATLSATFV